MDSGLSLEMCGAIDEATVCLVFFELYNSASHKPRLLSCGDTVCEECLQKSKKPRENGGFRLACPGGFGCEATDVTSVDDLPIVKKLIRLSAAISSRDEVFPCSQCKQLVKHKNLSEHPHPKDNSQPYCNACWVKLFRKKSRLVAFDYKKYVRRQVESCAQRAQTKLEGKLKPTMTAFSKCAEIANRCSKIGIGGFPEQFLSAMESATSMADVELVRENLDAFVESVGEKAEEMTRTAMAFNSYCEKILLVVGASDEDKESEQGSGTLHRAAKEPASSPNASVVFEYATQKAVNVGASRIPIAKSRNMRDKGHKSSTSIDIAYNRSQKIRLDATRDESMNVRM